VDVNLGSRKPGRELSTIKRGSTALRNGLLMLFRQAHWRSVPDALAHYGASVTRAGALIGLQVKT